MIMRFNDGSVSGCLRALFTCALGLGVAGSACEPARAEARRDDPAAALSLNVTASTVALPPGGVKTADDLLTMLESAGRDLSSLQADLRWTKRFGEITGGDEQQVREGRLYFAAVAPKFEGERPTRRFQVDFVTETVNDVRHTKPTTYVFDGEWFVERQPEQRQVFRRQVVAPGQSIDPLAIGEGVFPLPIGQQKAKILERFDAELVPTGEDFPDNTPPAGLADTYQLRLVPKRGTDEAKQYAIVRIWYRKADLLPRMARTGDRDESSTEVFLTNVAVNQTLPATLFDTTRPEGWEGDDKLYRKQSDATAISDESAEPASR
jgi:hypothetical protein